MKTLITALVIIAIASTLLFLILKYIVIPIMEWRNKKLKHKIALQSLEFMKINYEAHLVARRKYYRAKQIENPLTRLATMSKYETIHQDAVKELNNSNNLKYVEFLTPEEKSELDELMSRQIYGLI